MYSNSNLSSCRGDKPDLAISSLSATLNPVHQPNNSEISWTIKNQGTADAIPADYFLILLLSKDNSYDESDIPIGGMQLTSTLRPGQTYSNSVTLSSSDYEPGEYYIIAVIDAGDGVTDINEGNNTRSIPFSIAATPEVIFVDAAATGTSNGTSWANAHIYLQDALTQASTSSVVKEIRVAQGVYKPDRGSTNLNGTGD